MHIILYILLYKIKRDDVEGFGRSSLFISLNMIWYWCPYMIDSPHLCNPLAWQLPLSKSLRCHGTPSGGKEEVGRAILVPPAISTFNIAHSVTLFSWFRNQPSINNDISLFHHPPDAGSKRTHLEAFMAALATPSKVLVTTLRQIIGLSFQKVEGLGFSYRWGSTWILDYTSILLIHPIIYYQWIGRNKIQRYKRDHEN